MLANDLVILLVMFAKPGLVACLALLAVANAALIAPGLIAQRAKKLVGGPDDGGRSARLPGGTPVGQGKMGS